MKNVSDILNSLQNKPQFSKLSHYKCIARIQSLFSPPLQKMVKFAYIKNNTLFFVLNHPGAKQEFDNNIQSIKSALKFCNPDECKEENIQDIRAFVAHTPAKVFKLEKKEPLIYPERSKGEFEINIHNQELKALVKSIQNIIKEKNATTRDN